MKKLVVYYSYSGNAKRLAQQLAANESADSAEISDVKKPNKLKAYTVGVMAAIRGKSWKIQPLAVDLSEYDSLTLFFPVWASNPPPAFNALLEILPSGKVIDVKAVSKSGSSECRDKIDCIIKEKGSEMASYENIKS